MTELEGDRVKWRSPGGMLVRAAAVTVYLAGTVAAVALLDDSPDATLAFAIWMAVSVLLGAVAGHPLWALLALLAIPIAIPFGIPDDPVSLRNDPVFPTAFVAIYLGCFSAAAIFLAALGRMKFDARQQRTRLRGG